ncbi:MAG: 4Fe-4S double cluster binding domain-containing protein [Anaerolineae bacterium]
MITGLLEALEEQGYLGRVVSTERLRDLEEGIEAHHRSGAFDELFYQERLTGFVFEPPESLPHARSLIVVAIRQPQIRLTFIWKGTRIPADVPPTYLHWQETDRQVEKLLAELLEREGYHVAPAQLPKKLLAVRSGLAEYGRNNITYVPGMGSFHRLVAFYSDLPCEQEQDWREPVMMERCETCRACLRGCPSGAITAERFLLRAERCIVFHNEQPGEVPFPAWMEPSWHNCLVGCMLCQRVCPEDRDVLAWIEDRAEFSAQETALLVGGAPLDRLPAETVRKLEEHDLVELFDLLPRNLGALFGEHDRS